MNYCENIREFDAVLKEICNLHEMKDNLHPAAKLQQFTISCFEKNDLSLEICVKSIAKNWCNSPQT